MKAISPLLAAMLAAGCASAPQVQTDYDREAPLDLYRSYAWRQQPPIRNPLLKQRVVAAIDLELAARGWEQRSEEDADVLLVANVSAREEQSIDAFYDGPDWNGWGWRGDTNAGGGVHRVQVHSFTVGTLVLDMFDAETRQAVWRATAEGSVPHSEERRNRDAIGAVREMFRDFPPGG